MVKIQRNRTLLIRWALVHCVALLLCAPRGRPNHRFSGIAVFGTSRPIQATRSCCWATREPPPDFMLNPLLIPSVPYAKGGHHFSNGATWVEQYGNRWPGRQRPRGVERQRHGGHQFRGGRRQGLRRRHQLQSHPAGGHVPHAFRGRGDSQALYVIEMGSNDIRDSFQIYASGGNGVRFRPRSARSRRISSA